MSADGSTRASLLWRLKSGEASVREIAWAEFHRLYVPTVRRFAKRLGASQEQAEDIAQDVMLGFFSVSPQFVYEPAKGRFRGYLKTCACHAMSKHEKEIAISVPAEQLEAASSSVHVIWEELWEERLLEQATAEFNSHQGERARMVFKLCILDGMSPQDVAEQLGMNADAVYKSRQRAMTEFRKVLSRLVEDEP